MSRTLGAILMTATALALCAPLAGAQTISGTRQAEVGARTIVRAENYVAPRNAMGQPDLNGLWTNATLTTLERPPEYGDRLVMTDAEANGIEGTEAATTAEANRATNPSDRVTDLPVNCGRGFSGVNCGYNSFWVDPGSHVMNVNGEFRTSFLVAPANGRLPQVAPAAVAARAARPRPPTGPDFGRGDNPESMTLAERCLKDFGSSSGPPMMPLLYNNTYQIVQTPTDVMIQVEMVHDVRIVHLVDKDHPVRARPDSIRQWMGDSVGWYEGDTLVVVTANFRPGQGFRGVDAPITERFKRINDRQILYSFEINDPNAFTAPIKAELAMNATPGPLYEYACHEGNYALPHILAGERRADEEAARTGRPAASAQPANPGRPQ
jgi:hypothetical protein